ncbi:5-formyltetrahydrofolate cyclo-ligase [Fulvivirga kasyanovii]|uniref:5-formyltetrahydrofolate cyclo-ligase n=1 Tax=Fulvivirga kasyanovii TaxID=396812 RepID=A0ABW9RJ09_9BACT|nr:5-formyltetrahydrofolate cyclo-ligase [Fulvivirga kasyanovii]MTI24059.1 5-formyltetrahydrofolate cyclo-ligase [Fulvivirga kasyanovii]
MESNTTKAIREEKSRIREKILQLRSLINLEEKKRWDEKICTMLLEIIDQRKPKVIHTFLPTKDEINLYPVIKTLLKKSLTVVTPRPLPKRQMEALVLNSLNELEEGIYGTRHPANSQEFNGNCDLIIVPGLAFDHDLNRLGYGGSYYDTFLEDQHSLKIGICYPFQMIEKVPVEPHDQCVDQVILPA